MSPAPVPKPANAGVGKVAITNTNSTYANLRSGPGTNYDDIGDIFDKTLVTYYPGSNQNGWVYLEQFNTAGWISASVVTFNDVDIVIPDDYPPTPYDGKAGVWHWKGDAIAETTIAQFIANFKKNAPNVKGVWVKIGDGANWQGTYDSGEMAINGPDDVKRWVQALGLNGLEFHGWMVMKGQDINGEASIITQVANIAGVQSIIMDVEPYDLYWEAGSQPIVPLMQKVRAGVPKGFHIGMAVDPREGHYKSIYPGEWQPYVDSIHPMAYWNTFRRTVQDIIDETYRVWTGYGKPIIPIFPGSAPLAEQKEAISLATAKYGAKGLSWWRYGVIGQWDAINIPLPASVPSGNDSPPPNTTYGKEVIIFPDQGTGYRSGSYTGQNEFKEGQGSYGWKYFYTTTEPATSKVWVEYKTILPEDGIYQISVFIPAAHASTKKARYKVHGIRGTNTEVVVDLNQSIHRNEWVPLGVFDLVKNQENAGKVYLNDVTGESGNEIAFDAVRYRQIIKIKGNNGNSNLLIADGFDAPVGTAEERAGDIIASTEFWFGQWRDATGFGRRTVSGYISSQGAYHTGADLNWQYGDNDLGKPVYSSASGTVIFQASLQYWGNVTVIRHDPLYKADGAVYYTRYGHMQNVKVKVGDRVARGTQIGEIGTGGGRYVAHLHFDVVRTTIMETKPSDWPKKDIDRLERDYVDPRVFIINNRPKKA